MDKINKSLKDLMLYNDSGRPNLVYFLQQNMVYVMKSSTYEIIRSIKAGSARVKYISFRYFDKDYLLAYDNEMFNIYPFNVTGAAGTSDSGYISYKFDFKDVISIYNFSAVS